MRPDIQGPALTNSAVKLAIFHRREKQCFILLELSKYRVKETERKEKEEKRRKGKKR